MSLRQSFVESRPAPRLRIIGTFSRSFMRAQTPSSKPNPKILPLLLKPKEWRMLKHLMNSMWRWVTLSTPVSIWVSQYQSKVVKKVFQSLPERFHAQAVVIEENKDLNTLRVDELVGNLQTFEENHAPTTKSKWIALMSTKSVGTDFSDKSGSNFDDEDFEAIFVKKFKKSSNKKKNSSKNYSQKIKAQNKSNYMPKYDKLTRKGSVFWMSMIWLH